MFWLIIYLSCEIVPNKQLIKNIIVVTETQILRKIMLLTIYPVTNQQKVIGISVTKIVKNSISRYMKPNTDSCIFILSNIKFYFYIISV